MTGDRSFPISGTGGFGSFDFSLFSDLSSKNCFHLDSFLYGPDEEERLVRNIFEHSLFFAFFYSYT